MDSRVRSFLLATVGLAALLKPASAAYNEPSSIVAFPTHAALLAGAYGPDQYGNYTTLMQQGYHYTGEVGATAWFDWNATSTATANGVTVIAKLNSVLPGRYLLRIPPGGINPEAGGAYCDEPQGSVPNGTTIHDDTVALNNLMTYLSAQGGGTLVQSGNKFLSCSVHSANLVVPTRVTVKGAFWPQQDNRVTPGQNLIPFISIAYPYQIVPGSGVAIRDFLYMVEGLPSHLPTMAAVASYQNVTLTDGSVGIHSPTAQGVLMEDVAGIGFQTCILADGGGKVTINRVFADCATTVDMSHQADTSQISNIHSQNLYTREWGGHLSTYAISQIVNGGTGYTVNDNLTIPGGNCTDQPHLIVATVSGGVITGLTIDPNHPGDCTFLNTSRTAGSPQTWGVTSATIVNNGSGGTDGTGVALTIVDLDCDPNTPPILLGTISGGQITAITGVSQSGVCNYKQQQTVDPVTSPDGLLAGAKLSITSQRNPLSPTGGTGSGARATILTQPSNYRPGALVTVHDTLGVRVYNTESEGNQVAGRVNNGSDVQWIGYGGEGTKGNEDRQPIGLDLGNCVKNSTFRNAYFGTMYININALQRGDTCNNLYTHSANPVFDSGNMAMIPGFTYAGILAGPGSQGNVSNMTLQTTGLSALGGDTITLGNGTVLVGAAALVSAGSGYTASTSGTLVWAGTGCTVPPTLDVTTNSSGQIATVTPDIISTTGSGTCAEATLPANGSTNWTAVGLGAGSGASFNLSWQGAGTWGFNQINWAVGNTAPPLSQWLYIDAFATPPIYRDLAWGGSGSLVAGGDFRIDQVGGSASHTVGANNGLITDGWRFSTTGTLSHTTFQQNAPGQMQPYAGNLQITIGTSETVSAANKRYVYSNVESIDTKQMQWAGATALPAVVDWCAKSTVPGTADLFLTSNAAHGSSYVHPFVISTGLGCWSIVVTPPATGAFGTGANSAGPVIGFDEGSGSGLETAQTDQWVTGFFTRHPGAIQLAANQGAVMTIGPVHVRPGPWITPYTPLPYRNEFVGLQQRFRKSVSGIGVAPWSPVTPVYAGAATATTPSAGAHTYMNVEFSGLVNLTPTATFLNPAAANANCYDTTTGADIGTAAVLSINSISTLGTRGMTIDCPPLDGSHPASGDLIAVHWYVDSGL